MRRLGPLLTLLALAVLLPGGCPWLATTGNQAAGTVSNADGSSDGSQADAGLDDLARQYPGCNEPAEADAWRAEVLRLVNEERAAYGSPPVAWSDPLGEEAASYACQLIYYDFFSHVNPVTNSNLGDRAAAAGYEFSIVGENLAAGQPTPAAAVADWMASPCHRQNIINPAFTELGVGVRLGGDLQFYWVQEFGRPLSAGPIDPLEYHDPECTE